MIKNPFISFILPIRNEHLSIERTINSIMNQKTNGIKFEIIIADGMSTDGTRGIIKRMMAEINEISLIDNVEKIVSTGFNRALSIANGDYIIRIDGHCKIEENFLKNSINCLNIVDAHCVGGPTIHIANTLVGDAIRLAQTSQFGVGSIPFRQGVNGGMYVDTLAFGLYKREVFTRIGGYDIELVKNQDDEFNFRMIQNGLKIWLDHSIKSFYYPRSSLIKLFKQYFLYGFYKIRVFQKRGSYSSLRHLIPLLFVLSIIFSVCFHIITDNNLPIVILCLLYLSLSIIFTIFETIKNINKRFSFIFLPICYFIIHIAYGFGSFLGIFYFMNKWNDRLVKDNYFNVDIFSKNAPH